MHALWQMIINYECYFLKSLKERSERSKKLHICRKVMELLNTLLSVDQPNVLRPVDSSFFPALAIVISILDDATDELGFEAGAADLIGDI